MNSLRQFAPETPERARSALAYLDPGCSNHEWVRLGQAIHAEWPDETGFGVWRDWSADGANHAGEADCRNRWRTFKQGGGVTISALYVRAREAGWRDSGTYARPEPLSQQEQAARKAERDAKAAGERAAQAAKHAKAAAKAGEIWLAASPDIALHPYSRLKALSFGPHVRRGLWPQNGWSDALLVPVFGPDQKIISIEAISPDGKKMGLKDGARSGGICPLAPFRTHLSGVVIIAEGLATAAACMAATGYPAVAAFSCGNLRKAAQLVLSVRPDARIVVAADLGAETQAREAAAAVGGVVAVPVGLSDSKGDFWDLYSEIGADVVRALIEQALRPVSPATADASPHDEAQYAQFEPVDDEIQSPCLGPMSAQKDQMPTERGGLPQSVNLDGGINELGIFPLGRLGSMFGFWRCDSSTVELLRAADLERGHGLFRLASLQRWEYWSLGQEGKFDKAVASNALIQWSIAAGEVDLSRVPQEVASTEHVLSQYNRALLHARPSGAALAGVLSAREEWSTAIHFDEFAQRVVVTKELPSGGGLGAWTDSHDTMLGAWCTSVLGVDLSASVVADGIMILARQRSHHPVRTYLESLVWDGVPRLSKWLIECAGADDDAYHRAVAAKTLIGAVARIFRPGAKVDTAMILEGPQGLKKSSLIRAMVPDVGWFAENLGSDDIANKDCMIGLQGRWIVEFAEMSNLRKSEVNAIKSFLTRCVDSYRAPYGRRTEDHPRQTIFIGSVNPDADGRYLRDSTGGRRFWPVACRTINIDLLLNNRDQLWAEAVARYNDDEPWWLSSDLEAVAAIVQADRLEANPWSEHVAKYVDYLEPSERSVPWSNKRAASLDNLTAGEVFLAFQGRVPSARDMADTKLIADALKDLGWSSCLIPRGRSRVRGWKR